MLCERCRAQPVEIVVGNMCLCAPCAAEIGWSSPEASGYATGSLFPVSPFEIGQSFGRRLTGKPEPEPVALPLGRIALALGGLAILSLGLMWVYKIHEGAVETRRGVMRAVEKHPEMMAL